MRDCRRIVILRFLSRVARENCSADSYRLSKLLAIEFDRLSLEIKAFAWTSAGQQRAVIGDMANDCYVFNIQKLRRRGRKARRWCGNTGECSGAYQREQSRSLCGAQTLDRNRDNRAKSQ